MTISPFLPIVLVGSLREDYLITSDGIAHNGIQGGHLFYTAAGVHFHEKKVGLVARVGSNFPDDKIAALHQYGFDINGIKRLDYPVDHRFFTRYDINLEKDHSQPPAHFANLRLPLPKELLGYRYSTPGYSQLHERTVETIIYRDIPKEYHDTTLIHLAPHDYLTHTLIPQDFRQQGSRRITLRANPDYMIPQILPNLGSLLNGLHVFFCNEEHLGTLFHNTGINDFDRRVKTVCDHGCDAILIFRKGEAFFYDARQDEALQLAYYPTTTVNRTGIKDTFCGGFIGALSGTYRFPNSLAAGVAAASFATEADHPFYTFDTVEGIYEARAKFLLNRIERAALIPPTSPTRRRFF